MPVNQVENKSIIFQLDKKFICFFRILARFWQ
ncbi:hypothetical protein H650_16735 [Enterobacter sp. R4-368]|nr:hypothetical protein H650_16735 [Enterobacter sp. R4-368]